MAKNWMAYEAVEAVMGNNVNDITEVGSRYPLFTRMVAMANNDIIIDLFKAIPKVTARVVETGLKDLEVGEVETEETEVETKEVKKETKKKKEKEVEADDSDETETDEYDYEELSGTDLYKLCCKKGISGKVKSRSKDNLIKVLRAFDAGEDVEDVQEEKPAKKEKATKKKSETKKKAVKEEEPDELPWSDDEDEEEEETDVYAGKTAKELYTMCKDRGIKVKPKQKADVYADLLKKQDAEDTETEEDSDDEDDWEI